MYETQKCKPAIKRLARILGIASACVIGLAVIPVAGWVLYMAAWGADGGMLVRVPWAHSATPAAPSQRAGINDERRTRDSSRLAVPVSCQCGLLFWKRMPAHGLMQSSIDFFTGFSGVVHVSADCCLSDGREPWVIESTHVERNSGALSGPQLAPLELYAGRDYARVGISQLLDCGRFLNDLKALIDNPRVRHKTGDHGISYVLGLQEEDLVTCSGYPARCILKQPESLLARALREALKERFAYGEATPDDLARALAIAGARGEDGRAFTRVQAPNLWPFSILLGRGPRRADTQAFFPATLP